MATSPQATDARVGTLVDLLGQWAREQPDERAYVFLSDRGGEEAVLTFAELDRRARAFAARLADRARPGDRALLLFPPGLDFIVAFFGCLCARLVAVPMMVPRRKASRDSTQAICADCAARLALTTAALAAARPDVVQRIRDSGIEWVTIDDTSQAMQVEPLQAPGAADIALLQYTSGSTSVPKGVMVSHDNLLQNLEMVRLALGNTRQSTHASWVPLYHDMGLILNVLQSFYLGALGVLTSPVAFLQRPMGWLRAIHAYRAEVASAPNFAFDLCVSRFREEQMIDVDLSCWKVAVNAAEPVRADTIERFIARFASYGFDARAMCPGYGLAEATVGVAFRRRSTGVRTRRVSRTALLHNEVKTPAGDDDVRELVGCGFVTPGQEIAIVDPDSRRRLRADEIGEVWASGPNIALGYWSKPDATEEIFDGRIAGEEQARWLRTGDLGFIDADGELTITGRIKDVIIIRGMNHYPQDIETTVQGSNPALRPHCGAAFAVTPEHGAEQLVVVQEVERTHRHRVAIDDLAGDIREAVINEHEVMIDQIVLINPGTIPKTTSGKIQRNLTRQLWLQGGLDIIR